LRRELIRAAAARYGIAEEAIAGAVLWDALENPYKRPLMRLGPGKVRPSRLGGPSAAELAERAGLVPFSPATALARAGPSFQSGPFYVLISRAFPMPEAGLEPATRGL
jgi:hypothetical protein